MNKYFEGQSIQVTLNGFSFLKQDTRIECAELDNALSVAELAQVRVVEWSTSKVMIIPFELFDHALLNTYLQTTKLIDSTLQSALFAVSGEYVAVWAAFSETLEYLSQRVPSIQHTHPLLKLLDSVAYFENAIAIEVYDQSLLHIVSRTAGEVEQASAISISSLEDVLYYVLLFAKGDTQKRIVISSMTSSYISDFLSTYFNDIVEL